MSDKDFLTLRYFIFTMRSQTSQNLYKPSYRCVDNNNLIHSEYVYMRAPLSFTSSIVGSTPMLSKINLNTTCNKSGLNLPCIGYRGLNDLINQDNDILEEWISEIEKEINAKENDSRFQELKNNQEARNTFSYNPAYNKRFLDQVKRAFGNYESTKYTKHSFDGLNPKCQNIDLGSYEKKYQQYVNSISRQYDLSFKQADFSYFSDMGSFIFSDSGLDNEQLKRSRGLLQKIMQQITAIEMKTQVNKTKLSTLVSQYSVLKQIRKTVDKRIGAMQTRVDELNTKRGQLNNKIEDLHLEINRLKRSKLNVQKEMQEIVRDRDLSATRKSNEIRKLNNIKSDLDRENFALKKRIANLRNNKVAVEKENKKMQSELKNMKNELSSTETHLRKVSSKLNSLNVKVDENKIKEELLKDEDLSELKAKVDKIAKEQIKPSPKEKKSKSSEQLVSSSELIPIDDLEEPKPKRKRGRPRKSSQVSSRPRARKPRARKPRARKQRVDDLDLFEDDDTPRPRKRKRGRPRKKTIKIKVKRKRKSKSKRKRKKKEDDDDDDDDELEFNFSLRNLM